MENLEIWDRYRVEGLIPHRGGFLFLNRVIGIDEEHKTGLFGYTVPGQPFWASWHFPDNPIMPGVLLAEAGAQALACLVMLTKKEEFVPSQIPALLGLDGWKFYCPVQPGDALIIDATIEKTNRRGFVWGGILIHNQNGEKVALGKITGALMPKDKIISLDERRK